MSRSGEPTCTTPPGATLAAIDRLVNHPSALIFVASDLAGVVPAIIADARVRLLHFSADISGDRPRFDYLLRDGMSTQRLGMTLLRQERVLDLLERAARPGVTLARDTAT